MEKYIGWFFMSFIALMATYVCILFGCSACTYLNHKFNLKDDNAIEQAVEAVIKDKIGLDIDLTPEDISMEKK